jgi:superkiller protein 3
MNSARSRQSCAIRQIVAGLLLTGLGACNHGQPASALAASPDDAAAMPTEPQARAASSAVALPAEAAAIFERLEREFPAAADAALARGQIADLFGKTSVAVRCWEECLALNPKFAAAHEQIGVAALNRGDFDQAVARLQTASELQPDLPEARLHLGKALLHLGKYAEARDALEEQVTLQPGAFEAWFRLGQAHLELANDLRAKECYEKAIEINRDYRLAWFGLAQACQRLGEEARARECRERFLQLDQEQQQADRARRQGEERFDTQLQGFACTIAGDFFAARRNAEEARAYWRRAAEIDAANVFCRRSLGRSLAEDNRLDEAIAVFQELQELQPKNLEHRFTLAAIFRQQRRMDGVEDSLQQILEIAPDNAAAASGLAQLYLNTSQKLPEAKRLAQRAAQSQPSGEAFFLLSAICLANQDRQGAKDAIDQALLLEPGNPKYAQAAEVLGKD